MTIIPAGPAGHYTVFAQGMYKNSVLSTVYTGEVVKNGNKYEGSLVALSSQDPEYLNPPPFKKLPDINAGWSSMELSDCNTLQNTIPFFGVYFGPPSTLGAGIWEPGTPLSGVNWVARGKVPLLDQPDVDLIPILTGGTKPIVETDHRLSRTVNPALLHHD